MKKIISLLCLLAICLPLCACGPSLAIEETKTSTTENKTNTTKEDNKADPIVYPNGFSVGFGRVDISGPLPVAIWEGEAKTVRDPLMLTCVAVCDGENVVLIMSIDSMKVQPNSYQLCAKIVEKEYGIPGENLFMNPTHSHTAPSIGSIGDYPNWHKNFYKQFPIAVEKALRDLSPAKAFTGMGHTDNLTFVRRYLMSDGTYNSKYNVTPGAKPVAHESEADNELRTIRFDREGKKDILMVNYQTHYFGIGRNDQLSADFVGAFRDLAEKELDSHFIYCSGSSGNLNFSGSSILDEQKYPYMNDAAAELVRATRQALQSETETATGKVVVKTSVYAGTIRKESPERVAIAKEINDAGVESERGRVLMKQHSMFDLQVGSIVKRSQMGDTLKMNFFAASFGDIAIATAPFEQFDTNGQEVRAASPFKMTFTLSMTNESNNYVPSAPAYEHGGYEPSTSLFIPGSGEEFAREQIRLLNECKSAS